MPEMGHWSLSLRAEISEEKKCRKMTRLEDSKSLGGVRGWARKRSIEIKVEMQRNGEGNVQRIEKKVGKSC